MTIEGKGKQVRGRQRLTSLGWLERVTGVKQLMKQRKENEGFAAVTVCGRTVAVAAPATDDFTQQ